MTRGHVLELVITLDLDHVMPLEHALVASASCVCNQISTSKHTVRLSNRIQFFRRYRNGFLVHILNGCMIDYVIDYLLALFSSLSPQ